MKTRSFLLLVVCLLPFMETFSGTPYEDKCQEIEERYYTKAYSIWKYGYEAELSFDELFAVALTGPVSMFNLSIKYPDTAAKLDNQMKAELKRARSLMTEEDFRKEWLKTDYGKIINAVNKKLGETMQKSQYETKAEYNARMQPIAKQLFIENCNKTFKSMKESLELELVPEKYDAETQIYELKIYETYKVDDDEISNSFKTKIKIAPQIAQNLTTQKRNIEDLQNVKWCIEDDKNVFINEAKIILGGAEILVVIKKAQNIKPLKVEFSKLRLDYTELAKFTWNYTDYKEPYDIYNDKLQIEVAAYNKRLLASKYNVNAITMCFLPLDKAYKNDANKLEELYNAAIATLGEQYETKLTAIKEELKATNFSKYAEIYSQEHPEMSAQIILWKEAYACYNLSDSVYSSAYINSEKPARLTCEEKQELINQWKEIYACYNLPDSIFEHAIYDNEKPAELTCEELEKMRVQINEWKDIYACYNISDEKFKQIYFNRLQLPILTCAEKDTIAKWKYEYKCFSFLESELVFALKEGRKPASETCKEKYFHLFDSIDVYEKWYNSNQFMIEVKKREAIIDAVTKRYAWITLNLANVPLDFKGCLHPKKQESDAYKEIQYIESNNIKYYPKYYNKLLLIYFLKDEKMKKECLKNGSKFSSIEAFFEAYIDPKYKKILNLQKKK